ncbi:hypothetical protein [Pseudofrankia sp. BMG5.37]|uniref:hypothetical protein n=1 Tax=Pseudofrankia sp. BMG5.37 TaxID=3050035 RepID=UPI002893B937|nr:hypothetical protein [Pseudofrankia sp. BMG5.37]MDT3444179.1 hypothetical protein [Pseudofrankia sp. BMG5.37]
MVVVMDETPLRVGPWLPQPGRKKAERHLLVACTDLDVRFLLGDRDLETFRTSVLTELAAALGRAAASSTASGLLPGQCLVARPGWRGRDRVRQSDRSQLGASRVTYSVRACADSGSSVVRTLDFQDRLLGGMDGWRRVNRGGPRRRRLFSVGFG